MKAGGGTYRFAFVTNNSTDFWNIGEKGLRKAERDFPNVKVSMFRPLKGEVADQQRFLEDIMVQGLRGRGHQPHQPGRHDGHLRARRREDAARHHGLGRAEARRARFTSGRTTSRPGKTAGETAIAALKAAKIEQGKVALFVGRIDMQNAIERKKGIDETLGKMPGIEILPVFFDHTDRALAKKNVEDALARYPDLVLVMGIWSYNGPCAAGRGADVRPRAKKPLLVVFDEEEETLKSVQDGLISATIVQKPFEFGYQSIKALKEIKEGKTVPTFIDTGILAVNKDNVDKFWSELRELKK